MDNLITSAMQEDGALSDYQWIRDTLVSVLRVYYLSNDPFIADQMRDVIEAKGIYLPGYERNNVPDIKQSTPTAWMLTTASGFCRFYTNEFYDIAVMDAERFITEPATLTPLYKQGDCL